MIRRPSPSGVYSTKKVVVELEESDDHRLAAAIPTIETTLNLLQEDPTKFWDCNHPSVPCRFLNPYQFFQSLSSQITTNNSNNDDVDVDVDEKEEEEYYYKRLGRNNNNLPAITSLSWSSSSSSSLEEKESSSSPPPLQLLRPSSLLLPHNISFVHIHKCGGTTIKTLLAQTKQRLIIKSDNSSTSTSTAIATAQLNHYKYSFGGGSTKQKQRNQQRRQDHIDGMVQLQQQQQQQQSAGGAADDAIIFTVIRDPLERFVSAVQQVMHYNIEFRQKCLKEEWSSSLLWWRRRPSAAASRSTLQCAINQIQQNDFLRDVHLIPMATHFRLLDQYPTIQISVLHINDIPILTKYLDNIMMIEEDSSNNTTSSKTTTTTNTTTTTIITMPNARDRSQVKYATSKVLANMNLQRDCTPEMIQQLCKIYAIDVLLLKWLGYDDSNKYC